MNRIALALAVAVAAVSASAAAAQSSRKTTWDDLLKPLDVKTNPNVPIAPPQPANPPQAIQLSTTDPSRLDTCMVEALGALPKVEGARVANAKPEFNKAGSPYSDVLEFWDIVITVDFQGRPMNYRYACRLLTNGTAELFTPLSDAEVDRKLRYLIDQGNILKTWPR